jgi:hypothetical protein
MSLILSSIKSQRINNSWEFNEIKQVQIIPVQIIGFYLHFDLLYP